MKNIRIAVKKPNGDWQARTVEDSLPTYQKIVGGYIEHFDSIDGIEFFCNEEGKLKNLPENLISTNGDIIRGTIFAVRANPAGEFESLTDKDLFDLFCVMPETDGKYALYQGAVMCRVGDTCIKDGKEYTEVTFDNGEVSSVLSEDLTTEFDLNEGNEE